MPWKRVALVVLLLAEVAAVGLAAAWGKSAPVDGLVVGSRAAVIEFADQHGPWGPLVIKRVVTPVPSWLVAQAREGTQAVPGKVLAYWPVPAGTTNELKVALDPRKGPVNTFVLSLVADRGKIGVFEFYPAPSGAVGGMMGSAPAPAQVASASAPTTPTLDKPLVAGGKYVQLIVDQTYWNGALGDVRWLPEP